MYCAVAKCGKTEFVHPQNFPKAFLDTAFINCCWNAVLWGKVEASSVFQCLSGWGGGALRPCKILGPPSLHLNE